MGISIRGGVVSGHAIITPVCRRNRSVTPAYLEAADRLQRVYDSYARVADNQDINWHLILVREEPES